MFGTILTRVLLCGIVALTAWSAMPRPAGMAAGGDSSSSALQLYAHLHPSDRQLQPLDVATLADRKDAPRVEVGMPYAYQPFTVAASQDGATLAAVSYASNASRAQDVAIRMIDMHTGARHPLFHPAVPLWVYGISGDGAQLFGFGMSSETQQGSKWDVLDAANGKLVSSLQLEAGSYSGGPLYDAVHHRLYLIKMPPASPGAAASGSQTAGPITPILEAHDVASGEMIGNITLQGILAGSSTTDTKEGDAPVFRVWQPAVALSPDGSRIAVLDGETERLVVVDTQRLEIVQSEDLKRPAGLLERLGEALGVVPAAASAKEWLGAQLSMSYSPDGRYLYVAGRKGEIGADGKWTVTGLGLRAIDVASGHVIADALPNQWVMSVTPAPDGSAVYTVAGDPMGDSRVTLRRQDARTLAVTAERQLDDAPELYFLEKPTPVPFSWSESWPMAGHDPQRTNSSPAIGPINPDLLFQLKGLSPVLAGPDGSIYALSSKGLVALDGQGRQRWSVQECCGEGPPALAPNGMILGTGFHTTNRVAGQEDTEAIGIRPDGQITWRIQPFGVLKGAVPLVTESNLLYLPIVGPEGVEAQGLDVMSADGKLLQKLPPFTGVAVAPDGTIYGRYTSLVALNPDGKVLWQHALKGAANPFPAADPLVGRDGTVYVKDGTEVDAFAASGRLLWRYMKSDQALALAERSDGVLLVAGRHALDAVQPDGKRLWRVPIGSSRGQYGGEEPSLIVDGDGTAYAGSGDGVVWVISADGEMLSTRPAGGSHYHQTPGLLLGPDGRLIVSGTDEVMRVYAP